MKNNRILIVALFAFSLSLPASAQMFRVGAKLTPSFAVGNFGTGADGGIASGGIGGAGFGYGGLVTADYFFDEYIQIGFEGGYNAFPFEETMDFGGLGSFTLSGAYTMIPLHAVFAVHMDAEDEFDVYSGIGAGAAILTQNVSSGAAGGLGTGDMSETRTCLSVVPRVGMSFEIDRDWFFNVELRFTHMITSSETTTTTETVFTGEFDPNTFEPIMEEQQVTVTFDPIDPSYLSLSVGVAYTLWD